MSFLKRKLACYHCWIRCLRCRCSCSPPEQSVSRAGNPLQDDATEQTTDERGEYCQPCHSQSQP